MSSQAIEAVPPVSPTMQVASNTFNMLQGKILTVVDALFPEGQQNKATKDVLTGIIWDTYYQMLDALRDDGPVNRPVQRGKK